VSELPEVGDKIRVTYEGKVEQVYETHPGTYRVNYRHKDGKLMTAGVGERYTSQIEILEKAERLFDGAVYLDASGDLFRWDGHKFAAIHIPTGDELDVPRDCPTRPLRKVSR
jgi:hypothetical protein